jgi:hypothetical protein
MMDAICRIQKDGTIEVVLTFNDLNPEENAVRERIEAQGENYRCVRDFSYRKHDAGRVESKTGLRFRLASTDPKMYLPNT